MHPLRDETGDYRGVPYGPKARLILLFLQTEALKHDPALLNLAVACASGCLAWACATGANYKTVLDQAERIEHCVLRFRYYGRDGETVGRTVSYVVPSGPLLMVVTVSWELSEGFYDALTRHPVPICEQAIRLLADTCMPLDLYLIACRLHSLDSAKTVSWEALHLQLALAPACPNILSRGSCAISKSQRPSILMPMLRSWRPDCASGLRHRQSRRVRSRLVARLRTDSVWRLCCVGRRASEAADAWR